MTFPMPAYPARDGDIYVTNFSEYGTGAQPFDWTSRYNAGFTAMVQSVVGSLSGNALRWTKTAASRQALSWDRVPIAADCEILLRARAIEAGSGGDNIICGYVRGGGAAGTETGYRASVSVTSSNTRWTGTISRYSAGVLTSLGSTSRGPSPNYTANTWYYQRMAIAGSTIKRKQWYSGSPEPSLFDETLTDTGVTAAGWIGLQNGTTNPDAEIDFFGVALNGKTVPLP